MALPTSLFRGIGQRVSGHPALGRLQVRLQMDRGSDCYTVIVGRATHGISVQCATTQVCALPRCAPPRCSTTQVFSTQVFYHPGVPPPRCSTTKVFSTQVFSTQLYSPEARQLLSLQGVPLFPAQHTQQVNTPHSQSSPKHTPMFTLLQVK